MFGFCPLKSPTVKPSEVSKEYLKVCAKIALENVATAKIDSKIVFMIIWFCFIRTKVAIITI